MFNSQTTCDHNINNPFKMDSSNRTIYKNDRLDNKTKNISERNLKDEFQSYILDNFLQKCHVKSTVVACSFSPRIYINNKDEFLDKCIVHKGRPKYSYLRRVSKDFPLKLLPEWLCRIVNDISSEYKICHESIAILIFVYFAACLRKSCLLKIHEFFDVFPNLWGGIIAKPGSKKSPSSRFIFKTLQDIQNKRFGEAKAMPQSNIKKWSRVIVKKVTQPALGDVLENSNGSVTMLRDELEALFKSANDSDYRGSLCSLYDCESTQIDKKTGGSLNVEDAILSIAGCIPIDKLRDYYKKYLSSGFMDRFIFVEGRLLGPCPLSNKTKLEYANSFFKQCAEVLVGLIDEEIEPDEYALSNDAFDFFKKWYDDYETLYFDTEYYGKLQKAFKQAAKIILIIHVVDTIVVKRKKELEIPLLPVTIGCAIGDWLIKNMIDIHNNMMELSNNDQERCEDDKKKMISVLVKYSYMNPSKEHVISNYDLYKHLPEFKESEIRDLCRKLGLKSKDGCKQSDNRYGKGKIIPEEIINS